MARPLPLRLVASLLAAATLLVGIVGIVGIVGPPAADALIRRRTITPEVDTGLPIRTDGRQVSVTGPMACDPGEGWEVRASVSQAGVQGEGRSEGICRGDIQEWLVRVGAVEDRARFQPGGAEACAVLRTLKGPEETDRHEWCNDVVLAVADRESDGDGNVVSWVALAVGGLAAVVAVIALVRARPAR